MEPPPAAPAPADERADEWGGAVATDEAAERSIGALELEPVTTTIATTATHAAATPPATAIRR
jgi:hypothetical protein